MSENGEMSASKEVIDLQHLARYTLGEPQLNCEILGLFAQQSEACLSRLKETATESVWREAAHSLKGAASGVGAFRVAHAAEAAFACVGHQFAADRLNILDELAAAVIEAQVFIAAYVPENERKTKSA